MRRLDIKRKLCTRSDRVKCVDFHGTEPWLLSCLYNGYAHIHNYENQQCLKSFEVGEVPIRAGRFVCRKSWIVLGSDDMSIRVFNYNTMEQIHQFEAHSDYIRSLLVHPTDSYFLTCSGEFTCFSYSLINLAHKDDMTIKLWDWENKFTLKQTFEGHLHYVMQVALNPKDLCTFASASLDRTVKVWQLGSSSQPNFTLEGHENGVNCVSYCPQKDRPYLASGGDDNVIRVWDYQNKSCIHTLHGHIQNVSCVLFHPEMPLIISGSEDGSVKLWHSTMFRHENTLNYVLERCWAVTAVRNNIAIGFDQGSLVLRLGREEPAVSMDRTSGKVVWALNSADIQQVNLRASLTEGKEGEDGSLLPFLATKDMGTCDLFPHTLIHSPNGRFFAACGDGEYVVYTATAVLRNKAYGNAHEFCWSHEGSADFAIRYASTLQIFKNFKETVSVRLDQAADALYGGRLIGVRSPGYLSFYEWEKGTLVASIELTDIARLVVWADDGVHLVVAQNESFHILKLNEGVDGGGEQDDQSAFDIVYDDVRDSIKSALWIGDCLVYTTQTSQKLNYFVGNEIVSIAAHLDHPYFVLGYLAPHLFLIDKDLNIVCHHLPISLLHYQTYILKEDFDAASRILPELPNQFRTRIAQFLEKQGLNELAIEVTTDAEHRFELSIMLKKLDIAFEMATELASEYRWKQVASLALQQGDLELAHQSLQKANDTEGLFVLATSTGDRSTVKSIAEKCLAEKNYSLAFASFFILSEAERCLQVLVQSDRLAEGAAFALTYCPSQAERIINEWKERLIEVGKDSLAKSLANPADYKNLFPGFEASLNVEKELNKAYSLPVFAHQFDQETNRRNKIILGYNGEDSCSSSDTASYSSD